MTWQADDEVTTTFGSIKLAQDQAWRGGQLFAKEAIVERLIKVLESCGAEGCPSCRGIKHAIEEINEIEIEAHHE